MWVEVDSERGPIEHTVFLEADEPGRHRVVAYDATRRNQTGTLGEVHIPDEFKGVAVYWAGDDPPPTHTPSISEDRCVGVADGHHLVLERLRESEDEHRSKADSTPWYCRCGNYSHAAERCTGCGRSYERGYESTRSDEKPDTRQSDATVSASESDLRINQPRPDRYSDRERCPECGTTRSSRRALRTHLRVRHGENSLFFVARYLRTGSTIPGERSQLSNPITDRFPDLSQLPPPEWLAMVVYAVVWSLAFAGIVPLWVAVLALTACLVTIMWGMAVASRGDTTDDPETEIPTQDARDAHAHDIEPPPPSAGPPNDSIEEQLRELRTDPEVREHELDRERERGRIP